MSKPDIVKVIDAFFNAGKTKDLDTLRALYLDDERFSSFSEVPPYDIKDLKTAIMLEELRFVNISDYDYEIIEPKISIYGDMAVAAFNLVQSGMLVDNKTYTGEHITTHSRSTFVLIRQDMWKIAHMHTSRI